LIFLILYIFAHFPTDLDWPRERFPNRITHFHSPKSQHNNKVTEPRTFTARRYLLTTNIYICSSTPDCYRMFWYLFLSKYFAEICDLPALFQCKYIDNCPILLKNISIRASIFQTNIDTLTCVRFVHP